MSENALFLRSIPETVAWVSILFWLIGTKLGHPIMKGINWGAAPAFLGNNKTRPKE